MRGRLELKRQQGGNGDVRQWREAGLVEEEVCGRVVYNVTKIRMQIYVPGVMSVAGVARGDLNLYLCDVKTIISWKSVGIIIFVPAKTGYVTCR
jgi:hypothetical protein